MVHATSEGLEDAFHLQLEKEGRQLADGDARLDTEDVQLEIVGLLEEGDDCLFLWRKIWDLSVLRRTEGRRKPERHILHRVPPHRTDEIIGIGDQPCPVVAYQVIATLREFRIDMAWEGIDSTVVTLRYLCGNEPATFSGTFHEDDGIRYPCHNPVAAHEVGFVGIRLCHELRQQSAMPYHLSGRLTVAVGIDMIQTVRQDTHRLIAVLQSLSMVSTCGHCCRRSAMKRRIRS